MSISTLPENVDCEFCHKRVALVELIAHIKAEHPDEDLFGGEYITDVTIRLPEGGSLKILEVSPALVQAAQQQNLVTELENDLKAVVGKYMKAPATMQTVIVQWDVPRE